MRDTSRVDVPGVETLDRRQSIDLVGEWMGRYSWWDLKTGQEHEWSEDIVIETYDSKTGRFRGYATDPDGQDTRIDGEVFQNALAFHYISNKTNRPSFGAAAMQFDDTDGRTLEELQILHDVDQRVLMSGRYRWEKRRASGES